MSNHKQEDVPSRREFLKGLGAAGAGVAAASVGGAGGVMAPTACAAPSPSHAMSAHGRRHAGVPVSSAEFGRIFPSLPPFADASDTVRAALLEVGSPGGIMDAGDDLAAGPKALTVLSPAH